MSYYDEQYFCEPSEFDEKCEELIDMLRQKANDDIKAELEKLRKENLEMKEVFNNYNAKVKELEQAKRKYNFDVQNMRSEIEREVKKLRLSQMLEDFQTTLYMVKNVGKEKPKCDKCNEKGYIQYFTPRGRKAEEWCECRELEKFYGVEELVCHQFAISGYPERRGQLIGWYKLKVKPNSEEYYEEIHYVADKMYNGQDFSEISPNCNVYFYEKETAQKFANWLNEQLVKNKKEE